MGRIQTVYAVEAGGPPPLPPFVADLIPLDPRADPFGSKLGPSRTGEGGTRWRWRMAVLAALGVAGVAAGLAMGATGIERRLGQLAERQGELSAQMGAMERSGAAALRQTERELDGLSARETALYGALSSAVGQSERLVGSLRAEQADVAGHLRALEGSLVERSAKAGRSWRAIRREQGSLNARLAALEAAAAQAAQLQAPPPAASPVVTPTMALSTAPSSTGQSPVATGVTKESTGGR